MILRRWVLSMLQRCDGVQLLSQKGRYKVTLPRTSRMTVVLRYSVTKLAYHASFHVEGWRKKYRENLLKRSRESEPMDGEYSDSTPPLLILMVYRASNQELVEIFLRQAGANAEIRLWALDEIAPRLLKWTVGCGPGLRFSNLNRLYVARPITEGAWVVIADDDFMFVKGDMVTTIRMMKRADFSLAQPGQSLWGWWSVLFNVARPFMNARDTNYVEQGPLVIADPTFAKKIFPLPESEDMGWGIEAEWFRFKVGSLRMGIIDASHVVHWKQNAVNYAVTPELESMHERLAISGIESMWQLQSVNDRWWRWQRTPPWKARR